MSGNWAEELRREARQLENEIDTKLVSFGKLAAGFSGLDHATSSSQADGVPLLAASTSEHVADTMAIELEQLLVKLSNVNEAMTEHVNMSQFSNPALVHTLQRHRDILTDYTQEFRKTKSTLLANRERDDLLNSVRRDISSFKASSGLQRRSDYFAKENEHLMNSQRVADDAIGIAINAKESMAQQRSTFQNINNRMGNVFNRFPQLNNLMQKINLRKRRDAIILGLVIAACLIFLLLFALRR
ncbi:vesicle transport V-SNARE protein [Capsaspora owczarzaki ATCC 30864]|uniref:Golgi SNAP receptor complex member 1 n=1 Tax=Capsaspora owczarzaki (strain ATCC 30864) TaxID=595528 RepID=A0A0D2VXP9_CAPO3|nr:vesicle transport V-SNARE protein [Capsaspora owczarzaki ATCC 30864]KJE96452.1 vesicle transport V-SNARE protein [Capsaspora owczarzaki ATCC 30864]|eukprot:XP_004344399.1 vesicle transport V-SNARE protein [Capsaspora owczarzaki ATCC 30864]